GGLVPSVFIPLIIVWLIVLGVLFRGVKKGIEVANRIMIPTLVVVFIIIVLRAVTLDGAIEGLNAFFEPDFGEILNPSVWVARSEEHTSELQSRFDLVCRHLLEK